jgi:hypothetical protein
MAVARASVLTVENGERVRVALPDFEGEAGLCVINGQTQIAYTPTLSGRRKRPGETIEIQGQSRRVVTVQPSDVAGMVLIEIESGT